MRSTVFYSLKQASYSQSSTSASVHSFLPQLLRDAVFCVTQDRVKLTIPLPQLPRTGVSSVHHRIQVKIIFYLSKLPSI